LRFDVDLDGRPVLGIRNLLIRLQVRPEEEPESLAIDGIEQIDDFVWMEDGSLLVISGRILGEVTEDGFKTVLELPDSGMRLAPATADELYLYGGRTANQRREVYLLRRGSGLVHLLRAPAPVTAVAGNRAVTFLAADNSILLLSEGRAPSVVLVTDAPIRGLAFSLPTVLFYSTDDAVGQLSRPGESAVFIHGKHADIRVRGGGLYLFFPREGILRCSPLSHFANLSTKLERAVRAQ
jgi:hypothetical protein